jgi:hypothetical protein
LYEFDKTSMQHQPPKDNSVQRAVDLLLATYQR